MDKRKIGVVGAGLMGTGIALEFACCKFDSNLYDVSDTALLKAERKLKRDLSAMRRLGYFVSEPLETILGRIHLTTDLARTCESRELVIESVVEDLGVKREVFGNLDLLCSKGTILGTNSSSFAPSLLSSATRRPSQVIGMHYFNPPYLLPVVEIVCGPETSSSTVREVRRLLEGMGKKPAIVRKEVPGFIGNRLQVALIREALSLVKNGVATASDIDQVVRYGFGRRLSAAGPFEVFDIAGWDLALIVARQLLPSIDATDDPLEFLEQRVKSGDLGVKAGRGFYEWTPEDVEDFQERFMKAVAAVKRLDEDAAGAPSD